MPLPSTTIWSDFNINFAPHPITGDLSRLTNENSVRQSVKNLVLLQFYEKPFQPNIGSDIRNYLFELFTPQTSSNLSFAIREVIDNYEPRAEVLDVKIKELTDNNQLEVNIVFQILNNPNPVTLTLALERVR